MNPRRKVNILGEMDLISPLECITPLELITLLELITPLGLISPLELVTPPNFAMLQVMTFSPQPHTLRTIFLKVRLDH